MQVFKLYYKIFIKGFIDAVIIYIVIFSVLTLLFTNFNSSPIEQAFSVEKCRVAIIDYDKSLLSTNFSDYIKNNSKYVEISDTSDEGLKDALFFRNAEYIFIIPENFGEKFFTNDKISLQTMRIPNSTSGKLIDSMANKYLNTIDLYIKGDSDVENITTENVLLAIEKTVDDLSINTDVVLTNGKKSATMPGFLIYFNYLPYPIISILVLCISGITLTINKTDIKRRNLCSPVSTTKFNFGLFLGNLSMSAVIYFIFVFYAAIIYKKSFFTNTGLLVTLNGLILTTVYLSLSFLISNIANKKAISSIGTVLSIGSCFLGGVFVPQEFLSETVKNVAVINPAFWYIKANNILGSLNTFSYQTIKPVIFAMIVEICFAAAFLAISLVIIKQRRI